MVYEPGDIVSVSTFWGNRRQTAFIYKSYSRWIGFNKPQEEPKYYDVIILSSGLELKDLSDSSTKNEYIHDREVKGLVSDELELLAKHNANAWLTSPCAIVRDIYSQYIITYELTCVDCGIHQSVRAPFVQCFWKTIEPALCIACSCKRLNKVPFYEKIFDSRDR